MRSRPGLVRHEIATRKWRRDLVGLQKVPSLATWNFGQLDLRSRHHFWCRDMGGSKGGRDMEKKMVSRRSLDGAELI